MTKPFPWTLLLAASATGTALCLSVLAGWQRGGSLAERLVWVAIGMVLVVGAHLLPALVRSGPMVARGVNYVLWLACMGTVCYGHLTFFLLAQRHAGELRADTVIAPIPSAPVRSLTAIMADRAAVTAQWATAKARRCPRNCSALEARRTTLASKLDALDAEAEDLRRQQTADDRMMAQRDMLTVDPVTARLASLLGTTVARIDLLAGLAFATVLEALACLLWTIALRLPPTVTEVTPASTVTTGHAQKSKRRRPAVRSRIATHAPAPQPRHTLSVDVAVTQLAQDVAAGRVRPTVADIRRHLSCSQSRAAAMRRHLLSLHSAA